MLLLAPEAQINYLFALMQLEAAKTSGERRERVMVRGEREKKETEEVRKRK